MQYRLLGKNGIILGSVTYTIIPIKPILKTDTIDSCNYMLEDNGHMYRITSRVKQQVTEVISKFQL